MKATVRIALPQSGQTGLARMVGRILVTIDNDFGELTIVRGRSHAGIVRLVGLRAGQQGPVCERCSNDMAPNSRKAVGVQVVKRALEEPIRQIVVNAGVEGAVIVMGGRDMY